MDLSKEFKSLFGFLKKHKKIILIALICFFLLLTFFEQMKKIVFILIFISISSISKLYHKIFKSSIVIDIVLFTAIMASLVYENLLIGFIVGIPSLFLADFFAGKLSHFSLVSLIGIILIVILSRLFFSLPLILSLFILTIIYEAYACILYYFLGSSPGKILVFFISHFISNMIMIFSFSIALSSIMV